MSRAKRALAQYGRSLRPEPWNSGNEAFHSAPREQRPRINQGFDHYPNNTIVLWVLTVLICTDSCSLSPRSAMHGDGATVPRFIDHKLSLMRIGVDLKNIQEPWTGVEYVSLISCVQPSNLLCVIILRCAKSSLPKCASSTSYRIDPLTNGFDLFCSQCHR